MSGLAFRFVVVYLGLFSLATQMAGSLFAIPGLSFRGLGQVWPLREVSVWVAGVVFGAPSTIDVTGSNGETIFFLAQTGWLLLAAALVAVLWSALDRHRVTDDAAHRWFRFFFQLALAAQMFEYGMTKVIPNQFAAPSLSVLATAAGDLSLNTLFWTAVGAAPGYQMFTGWAELLGGVLLLVPRTRMAGALICLADMIHVLALNLSFDIGLKLTSLHLVLLALFLLGPDLTRLARFLVLDRAVGPSSRPSLFATRRSRRTAFAVQALWGIYLLTVQGVANVGYWYAEGGGSPRSPLYGIWNVEELAVDGEVGPPSENDYDRQWRRLIFDRPTVLIFQRTDDSFARFGVSIDVGARTLTLTKGTSSTWRSDLSFRRPADDQLVLDGEMDDHDIRLRLRLVEPDSFRLLNSPFRWIRTEGE